MAERGTVLDRFVTIFSFRTDRRSLRRLDRQIGTIRDRLNRASTISFFAGAAAVAPLAVVGKKAITVSAAMNRLEAATGATNEELAEMKALSLEVGSQLPLQTADIIEGMRTFTKLGNEIDQTMAATPHLAKFAHAADKVSFDDAARYGAVLNNTFRMGAENLGLVLDQMLKAETITAGSARGIGEALQYSSQAAADAALTTSEYIALLGVVSGAGRDVEGVSQGLQVFLSQMAKGMSGMGRGGKMIETIFRKLGIEKAEIRGIWQQDNKVARFLALMRERTGGDQDKLTAAFTQLVGTSYASAFSYLAQNADLLIEKEAQIRESSGETARQSGIMMQGLSGSYEEFLAMLDTVQVALSDLSIGGPIEAFLRSGSRFMQWMLETNAEGERLREWVPKAVGNALLLGTSFLGLGLAIRGVSFALGGFSAVYYGIRWARAIARKKKLGTMLGGLVRPTRLFTGSLRVLSGVMAGMLGWPALMLLAAGAAAYLLVRHWEPVSEFFGRMWTGVADHAEGAFSRVSEGYRRTVQDLESLPVPETWWDSLIMLPDTLDALAPLMTRVFHEIMLAGEAALGGLFDLLGRAVAGFATGAARAMWTAAEWANDAWPVFLEHAAAAAGRVNQMFVDAWNGLALALYDGLRWALNPLLSAADWIAGLAGLDVPTLPALAPALAAAAAPLPVGPPHAASEALRQDAEGFGPPGGSGGPTVDVGGVHVEIHAPGGDAEDIAQQVEDVLARQLRGAVEAADSPIDR